MQKAARNSTLVSTSATSDTPTSVETGLQQAQPTQVETISQRLLTHRVILTAAAVVVGLGAGLGAGALFN